MAVVDAVPDVLLRLVPPNGKVVFESRVVKKSRIRNIIIQLGDAVDGDHGSTCTEWSGRPLVAPPHAGSQERPFRVRKSLGRIV